MVFHAATLIQPFEAGPLNSSVARIDLPANIVAIMDEEVWERKDRKAKFLFKNDQLTIAMVSLQKNAVVMPRPGEGAATMQVIDGCLQVTAGKNVQNLYKDQVFAVTNGAFYSALAQEQTIVLMTITHI